MLIENRYFIPKGLYDAVSANADRERKTQFVGLMYEPSTVLPPGLARFSAMWEDLKSGRDCAWVYGPEREDLIAAHPAVVLWITPEASR